MNEHYIYTDRTCEECGSQIVLDPYHDEMYCLKCGLILATQSNWNFIDMYVRGMAIGVDRHEYFRYEEGTG